MCGSGSAVSRERFDGVGARSLPHGQSPPPRTDGSLHPVQAESPHACYAATTASPRARPGQPADRPGVSGGLSCFPNGVGRFPGPCRRCGGAAVAVARAAAIRATPASSCCGGAPRRRTAAAHESARRLGSPRSVGTVAGGQRQSGGGDLVCGKRFLEGPLERGNEHPIRKGCQAREVRWHS